MDENELQVTEGRVGYVVQLGVTALRSLMLINGGACVALLTFIGHLVTSEKSRLAPAELSASLLSFGLGLFFAVLVACLAFLGEGLYVFGTFKRHDGRTASPDSFLHLAILGFSLASLGLFLLGCFQAFSVFRSLAVVVVGK